MPDRLRNRPAQHLLRHVTISQDVQLEPTTKEELDKLYAQAYDVLSRMGFFGGAIAFHPYRHDGECDWTEGPHFHAVGFGHVDAYKRPEGWVVRDVTNVKPPRGRRRSWLGTLKYVLDHCLVPKARDHRYHSIRWFAALSYTKFSSRNGRDTTVRRTDLCVECGAEMAPVDQLLPPDGADALECVTWERRRWRNFALER